MLIIIGFVIFAAIIFRKHNIPTCSPQESSTDGIELGIFGKVVLTGLALIAIVYFLG